MLQAAHAVKTAPLGQFALWSLLRHGRAELQAQMFSSSSCSCASSSNSSPLTSAGWRDNLVKLSCLSISLQGHISPLMGSTPAAQTVFAAIQFSSKAAVAAAVTAAAPAGASLAFYSNSRGQYWLRQLGLADRNATHALVAANILSYGMQMISPAYTQACVRVGAYIAHGEYWRLVTAAFLHGGLLHLGVNMFALWNLGHAIEGLLGSRAFLVVYLGSAVAGNLTGFVMDRTWTMSMGSSSALFGLFGGYLVNRWVNRHTIALTGPELTSIAQTIGLNMLLMMVFSGHMDHWAHLGGFVGGATLTLLLGARPRNRW